MDLGYIIKNSKLESINTPEVFSQLLENVKEWEYFHDLDRIGKTGEIRELDVEKLRILA